MTSEIRQLITFGNKSDRTFVSKQLNTLETAPACAPDTRQASALDSSSGGRLVTRQSRALGDRQSNAADGALVARHRNTSGVRPEELMPRHSFGNQAGGYWKPIRMKSLSPSLSASATRYSGFRQSYP